MELDNIELRIIVFSLDTLEKHKGLSDNEYTLRAKIENFLNR